MRAAGRVALGLALGLAGCQSHPPRVGSKAFTEAVVLGEIAARACAAAGAPAEHRRQLGGTALLWAALRAGSIDAYAEYTGTLSAELLRGTRPDDLPGLRRALAPLGLAMTEPLGFENTYALGVPEPVAAARGLSTLSDLRAHPDLRVALSHEFLARADGWPGLRRAYDLRHTDVRGLDHDLAYRALRAGDAAVTDLYSTDAEIAAYGLRVLRDDRRHFPSYRAVILYRADLAARAPACARALQSLAGRIDPPAMIAMNAAVRLARRSEADVADEFLATRLTIHAAGAEPARIARVAARTREHLILVLAALLGAVALAVPLGVLAARRPRLGAAVLGLAGTLQTVPSLALLVLLVPLLGIGVGPAVAALFLYALLPVLQNTVTGLRGIAPSLRESAAALGLPPRAVLWEVELPLALPSILAGVRTAAVISVGTATLGALVGAGGYGQPILTGIRLDATETILEGAVPAALLALATQGLFAWIERRFVPEGLRGA